MQNSITITAVIINYRTKDLVERAILSFRNFYPEIPLLLIDNGSKDKSVNVLKHFADASPQKTNLIINPTNLHHGTAMDQALYYLQSRYVLFIDSDCEIRKGGFIELMVEHGEQQPRI